MTSDESRSEQRTSGDSDSTKRRPVPNPTPDPALGEETHQIIAGATEAVRDILHQATASSEPLSRALAAMKTPVPSTIKPILEAIRVMQGFEARAQLAADSITAGARTANAMQTQLMSQPTADAVMLLREQAGAAVQPVAEAVRLMNAIERAAIPPGTAAVNEVIKSVQAQARVTTGPVAEIVNAMRALPAPVDYRIPGFDLADEVRRTQADQYASIRQRLNDVVRLTQGSNTRIERWQGSLGQKPSAHTISPRAIGSPDEDDPVVAELRALAVPLQETNRQIAALAVIQQTTADLIEQSGNSSERSSKTLNQLTGALVAFTAVLVVLTLVLVIPEIVGFINDVVLPLIRGGARA